MAYKKPDPTTIKDVRPGDWLVIRGEEFEVKHGVTDSPSDPQGTPAKYRYLWGAESGGRFVDTTFELEEIEPKIMVKGKGDDEVVSEKRRFQVFLPGEERAPKPITRRAETSDFDPIDITEQVSVGKSKNQEDDDQ